MSKTILIISIILIVILCLSYYTFLEDLEDYASPYKYNLRNLENSIKFVSKPENGALNIAKYYKNNEVCEKLEKPLSLEISNLYKNIMESRAKPHKTLDCKNGKLQDPEKQMDNSMIEMFFEIFRNIKQKKNTPQQYVNIISLWILMNGITMTKITLNKEKGTISMDSLKLRRKFTVKDLFDDYQKNEEKNENDKKLKELRAMSLVSKSEIDKIKKEKSKLTDIPIDMFAKIIIYLL